METVARHMIKLFSVVMFIWIFIPSKGFIIEPLSQRWMQLVNEIRLVTNAGDIYQV